MITWNPERRALFSGLKGLVFDLDGTLIDSLGDIVDACNAALSDWHLPNLVQAEMVHFVGYGARHLCERSSGLSGEALERFTALYRQKTIERRDPTVAIYPGLLDAVTELKARGFRLAIYTNKPQDWGETLIHRLFPSDLFEYFYGALKGRPLKPSPWALQQIAEAWSCRFEEIAMVGDSAVDVETAHAAACVSIAVSWGFRTRQALEAAQPDVLVDTAADFLGAILGN